MRRQNPSFNLDELDLPGLRDELLAAQFDHETEPAPEALASPEAQADADALHAVSNFGRAGGAIGNALGHNTSGGFWDKMDRRGDQIVADSKDANKQAALRKQFEQRIAAQAAQAKQKLDAEGAAAQAKRQNELSDAGRKHQWESERLAAEQSFKAQQGSLDRSAAETRARILAQRQDAAAGAKGQGQIDANVQKLGDDLKDAPQMANDLAILNNAAAQSDIPGFGSVEGRVPEFLLSMTRPEGLEVRQAAKRAVQAYKLKVTGTAASEAEAANILKALGMGETASPEEFRAGLQGLTRNGEDAVKQVLSKYSPDVVATFEQRGGRTSIAAPSAAGGLPPEKKARLEELRAKRAAGALK